MNEEDIKNIIGQSDSNDIYCVRQNGNGNIQNNKTENILERDDLIENVKDNYNKILIPRDFGVDVESKTIPSQKKSVIDLSTSYENHLDKINLTDQFGDHEMNDDMVNAMVEGNDALMKSSKKLD